MADTRTQPRLRETIAAEIRVAMVRRQVTGTALAAALGKSQAYVSRRLSGDTAFDVDDLETIAATLQVKVADMIGHAERGDGTYVSVGNRVQDVTGALVTGTFEMPNHPIVAAAVPLPRPRRPQLTGR